MNIPLIVVITDSITNSVFISQVLEPISKLHYQSIHLISFERKSVSTLLLASYQTQYPHVQFHIFSIQPYLGNWSVINAQKKLVQLLTSFDSYELRARGPLAGLLCIKAASRNCKKLTIQARGLLAEEYAFAHRNFFWTKPLHHLRYLLFNNLEKRVYALTSDKFSSVRILRLPTSLSKLRRTGRFRLRKSFDGQAGRTEHRFPIIIEAVSVALADYLVSQYKTPKSAITIAQQDIPEKVNSEKLAEWRIEKRNELKIPETAYVYCYNGSAKPWQCPEETIIFFKKQLEKDSTIFLLIVSQDIDIFQILIQKHNIPENHIRLISVTHHEVIQYLAAADTGILFREAHVLNWVSRPTKALEYHATGLTIIHNGTVAWLMNNNSLQCQLVCH